MASCALVKTRNNNVARHSGRDYRALDLRPPVLAANKMSEWFWLTSLFYHSHSNIYQYVSKPWLYIGFYGHIIMYVYWRMYVCELGTSCEHAYVCVCMYAYMYMYLYVQVCVWICICMCVYVYACTYITVTCVYVYMYMYLHFHVCICVYMCMCVHVCMSVYIRYLRLSKTQDKISHSVTLNIDGLMHVSFSSLAFAMELTQPCARSSV